MSLIEIAMPKSWNEGTVSFVPVWSHGSTTTNFGVVWALQAVARSDDDAMDVAFEDELRPAGQVHAVITPLDVLRAARGFHVHLTRGSAMGGSGNSRRRCAGSR